MPISFNLEDIKFEIDKKTFLKAADLYEGKRVTKIKEEPHYFQATVIGTQPYEVFVDNSDFTKGSCDCYLGERDILCKHMIALAIYMVKKGQALTKKEKEFIESPVFSGKKGELTEQERLQVKKEIKTALRHIKPYNGPSRIWFAYQNSLTNGCRRLSKIISQLPVCLETAELLIKLLINLDRKLAVGGVDDSDGTVGNFIEATVDVLINYSQIDKNCLKAFKVLKGKETSFGWEERLVELLA